MAAVTPELIAQAIRKQESLSPEAWLARGDELFLSQRVMFLELVTFGRDGVEEPQLRAMVDFLSVLQHVAESLSDQTAAPVEMPEFRAAVERAVLWFQTLQADGPGAMEARMDEWFESMQGKGEPVIWALLMNIIQQHGILMAPLASGMVITLHAIADIYSARCAAGAEG